MQGVLIRPNSDMDVEVGQMIVIPFEYTGHAPDQAGIGGAWSISVVLYAIDGLSGFILNQHDTTHPTEGPVSNSGEISSGELMNDIPLAYEVVLYGNEDAWIQYPNIGGGGHPWYLLDSWEFIVSPQSVGVNFRGDILAVRPSEIAPGTPIELSIDYNAWADNAVDQLGGWFTRISADIDGVFVDTTDNHTGPDGHRTGSSAPLLMLGTMPDHPITGIVKLEGRGAFGSWVELDSRSVTLTPSGVPSQCTLDSDCPPGYSCVGGVCVRDTVPPPDGESKFPWVPVAIIGAGVALAAYAVAPTVKGLTK